MKDWWMNWWIGWQLWLNAWVERENTRAGWLVGPLAEMDDAIGEPFGFEHHEVDDTGWEKT